MYDLPFELGFENADEDDDVEFGRLGWRARRGKESGSRGRRVLGPAMFRRVGMNSLDMVSMGYIEVD